MTVGRKNMTIRGVLLVGKIGLLDKKKYGFYYGSSRGNI